MRIINLLPKEKQRELRLQAVAGGLTTVIWISVFSFLMVTVGQLGAKVYLDRKLQAVDRRVKELQKLIDRQENIVVKNEVRDLNELVSDYKQVADSALKWSKVLTAFAPLVPGEVRINSFTVEPKKGSVTINGYSPTREGVIELYNNLLADSAHFENVNYPFENLIKQKEVSFHFTFFIKPELLK